MYRQALLTAIPYVVAYRPDQRTFKGVKQVQTSPGRDHDVVCHCIKQSDLGRKPNACRTQTQKVFSQWAFLLSLSVICVTFVSSPWI